MGVWKRLVSFGTSTNPFFWLAMILGNRTNRRLLSMWQLIGISMSHGPCFTFWAFSRTSFGPFKNTPL